MTTKKRAEVPAPATASTSPALDELTGATVRLVSLPIEDLHPHPRNPRRELGDLAELADSIKTNGVRQPLTVVPHDAFGDHGNHSGYLVVIGHRRAAAAQLAGLTHVPAIVDAALTAEQQLELMLVENVQRSDLTAIEEADGYQGLLDLGVDEAAIAARTGRTRATVHARLQLVSLPRKAREAVHTRQATLADADLLARTLARPDVAAHPEVAKKLAEALGTADNFAFEVKREVDELEMAEATAQLSAELEAQGLRVIDRPAWDSKQIKSLDYLSDSTELYGPKITPKKHATCPGHVVWVVNGWAAGKNVPIPNFGCDGWRAHGHHDRTSSTPTGPTQTLEERRQVRQNNKDWSAATAVRREWIRVELLKQSRMPIGTMRFLAAVLEPGHMASYQEKNVFAELTTGTREHATIDKPVLSEQLIWRWPLSIALAIAELGLEAKGGWRRFDPASVGLMRFLSSNGYELTPLEAAIVSTAGASTAEAGEE